MLLRTAMAIHAWLLAVATRLGPAPRDPGPEGADILLTGTFHSANWIQAHIAPLAASARCRSIVIVGSADVSGVAGVQVVPVPRWLRVIGATPARLMTFWILALRRRPDVVGGFHLLVNGLAAVLVGRSCGARAWYFCVGGPNEALDGGVHAENAYFERLPGPDPVIERRLLDAVRACDLVITMGSSAAAFFTSRGVRRCEVIAGGIDAARFQPPATSSRDFDLMVVARLVPIKRLDRFVEVVRTLSASRPAFRAAMVGDGPLRDELEALVKTHHLESHVTFAGRQTDVSAWLRRARVFMLTSESEGLALAIMEAMTCGLPVVAPRVGDLGDLVEDGVNGFLVAEGEVSLLAAAAASLIDDAALLERFGAAAQKTADRYHLPATIAKWDDVLGVRVVAAR